MCKMSHLILAFWVFVAYFEKMNMSQNISHFNQLVTSSCCAYCKARRPRKKELGVQNDDDCGDDDNDDDDDDDGDVRNEDVLLRVKEQRNILHEISKRKANWIGHILRRNCLLKQVIEGKINGEMAVARRRGRRRRKLLDDLKDRRGYCHLKEEALDRTMWRNRFGGGFGSVIRQTAK